MSEETSTGDSRSSETSRSSEDDDEQGRKAVVKGRKADDEGREGVIVSGTGPPFVFRNGFAGKADPRPNEDEDDDIVNFCVAQNAWGFNGKRDDWWPHTIFLNWSATI